MATLPPLPELLKCAHQAAMAAGTHAFSNRHRRGEVMKSFDHDVKLKLDFECQEIATGVITSHYPDAHILGEEDSHAAATPADLVEWVIDPIDGTVNFSHGLPIWCTSVAARWNGESVAGVIYAPALDQVFAATRETATTCNGDPIKVSSVRELSQAMILMGIYQHAASDPPALPIVTHIAKQVQKVRAFGSAALDMCHVACGAAEAYWEPGIYVWDMAAAGLIATQAGGRTEVLEDRGNHRLSYLVTNGALHEAVKTELLSVL